MQTIEDKIKNIVAMQLGFKIDQVEESSDIQDDLGADSLDCVELLMAMEEEFGIEIPDEDALKLKTVKDVVEYIEQRKN